MTPVPAWLRWSTLAFLAVWLPFYWHAWGWANFLQLCDIAVFLTVAGLWARSSLLLSSQLVGALVIDLIWTADVAGRFLTGRHLLGGTEYMWDEGYPLFVRLLSLFHVAWPVILFMALRKTGYDRRGWLLQAAIAAPVIVVSRFVKPWRNINFAQEAPFGLGQIGPAWVHVGVSIVVLVVAVYLPTHLGLSRVLPESRGERR